MSINNTLKINKPFLSFFRERGELVNNKTLNFEFINSDCKFNPTYKGYLHAFEDILSAFPWLVPIKIRLPYTYEIEKENLQFLYKMTKESFYKWKDKILSQYSDLEIPQEEIEDYLNFDFNYKLEDQLLYNLDNNGGFLTIGYKTTEKCFCVFGLEVRKELFLKGTWVEAHGVCLSEDEITHNKQLLDDAIKNFLSKGYIIQKASPVE